MEITTVTSSRARNIQNRMVKNNCLQNVQNYRAESSPVSFGRNPKIINSLVEFFTGIGQKSENAFKNILNNISKEPSTKEMASEYAAYQKSKAAIKNKSLGLDINVSGPIEIPRTDKVSMFKVVIEQGKTKQQIAVFKDGAHTFNICKASIGTDKLGEPFGAFHTRTFTPDDELLKETVNSRIISLGSKNDEMYHTVRVYANCMGGRIDEVVNRFSGSGNKAFLYKDTSKTINGRKTPYTALLPASGVPCERTVSVGVFKQA